MKNLVYFFLGIMLISSCVGDNKIGDDKNQKEKPLLSIAKKHKKITSVNPVFEKEISEWKELKTVNSFLKKFENVSPKEALTNALELRDLTKSLKDSVKPKLFDIPSLKARVNVFYNETLRLADITFIPAATANDINLQIDKTIATFSSINSKINTILLKKKFEEEIDIDFNYIGLDSTRIDTITKNSIAKRLEEDRLRKKKSLKKLQSPKKKFLKPNQ